MKTKCKNCGAKATVVIKFSDGCSRPICDECAGDYKHNEPEYIADIVDIKE